MNTHNFKKNAYVKRQITKAIIELLKDKEIKEITINELAEKSGTGRVSFYRNFDSKEDIIEQYLTKVISNWYQKNKDVFEQETRDDKLFGSFFKLLSQHAELYQLLYKRKLLYLLRHALMKLLSPKPEDSNFYAYTVAFVAGGLYSWVEEWVKRGMPESPEKIEELLKQRKVVSYKIPSVEQSKSITKR
ncbi:TetR/AcrR family transcriptional regulator [Limosilactobacillus difficilis]|uniref:TetR/AcrR family transcriptional regulator n=1 Tax=Limosilactobacillus difficilis TaxID=2991838 RepID=UPI0024BBAB02|nr:TetR/AcrR family transcriptional regulator [Limosilactobacillus difficilis]